MPLLGFAQAGAGGFFDDAGFPAGQGWDLIELPAQSGEGSYALQVQGDSMLPLYRDGDMLDRRSPAPRSARATASSSRPVPARSWPRCCSAAPPASSISCRSTRSIPTARLDAREVEWLARIVWASQ